MLMSLYCRFHVSLYESNGFRSRRSLRKALKTQVTDIHRTSFGGVGIDDLESHGTLKFLTGEEILALISRKKLQRNINSKQRQLRRIERNEDKNMTNDNDFNDELDAVEMDDEDDTPIETRDTTSKDT